MSKKEEKVTAPITPAVVPKVEEKQLTPEEIKKLTEVSEEEEIISNQVLEGAVFQLLSTQPFVGHLIQMLTRKISKKIPTACVSVLNHRYALTINPDFFNKLSKSEAVAILTHEVYHLLNEHLKRCDGKDMRLFNVAADMAINQYINDLPKFDREEVKKELIADITKYNAMLPADKQLKPEDIIAKADTLLPKADKNGKCASCLMPQDHGLPLEKTAEYYYEAIQANKQLRQQFQQQVVRINMGGGGGGSGLTPEQQKQLAEDIKNGKVRIEIADGSHDQWDTAEGTTPEVLDEELKRMIVEAMEKAKKDFGRLPGGLQQAIYEMLQSKISWKAQLRSFLQVATRVLREKSRKRPSRRFGVAFPGQKSEFKLNLGVVFDVSGSIGDEELKLFLGELHRIHETGMADITVMEADAQVHKSYKYDPKMGKFEPHRFSGRGGTDAGPWLKALEEEGFDAGIILTDGYFGFNLTAPKGVAVMWALTESGYKIEEFHKSVPFGKKIKLELEDDVKRGMRR